MMSADSTRVLRWIYTQHDETLTCELRLAEDGLSYQLTRTPGPQAGPQTCERFRDVTAAFERQCELEQTLIASGWSLESYDSQIRVVDAERAVEPSGR